MAKILSKIGFLGAGNMAQAFIAGLLKDRKQARLIYAYDLQGSKLSSLQKKYKIQITRNAQELIHQSDMIVLATKPQDLKAALQGHSKYFRAHTVLSIVTGVDLATLSQLLPKSCKIIRSMPNNPALIGEGMTALFAKKPLSSSERKQIENIFKGVGDVLWVKNENQLDAVTGLSGSGPAYVYQFVKALTQAGVRQGLPQKMAYSLALKTLVGAALTLFKTGKSPEELISLVTSKKGTTLAGLAVMKKKGFNKMVEQVVAAATQRAKEIKIEFKRS